MIRTLYQYRPTSVSALAGLSLADRRTESTVSYFAGTLRLLALSKLEPGADYPTLETFLDRPKRDTRSAEDIRRELIAGLKGCDT